MIQARPFAVDGDELGIRVDLSAGEFSPLWHEKPRHAVCGRVRGSREHLEIHGLHHFGQLGELQGHAQVRLVRAVFVHGVRVAHDRKRIGQGDAEHLLEYRPEHAFENGTDLRFAQERGLAVDLGEFGLAVGAQVLVAEALGDLVVAVVARDHEELLEQLRRLRQREELPGMHARGYQVVARAFGRRAGEHRRLDVDEAVRIEILPHRHGGAIAQHQVLLHRLAAQVDDAVREAHRLREILVVELERRRERGVEDLDVVREHFDFARGDVRINGAFGTPAHEAGHLQHEFVADLFRRCESRLAVGIRHHLREALAVAQVDENHPAVVAAAVRPAGKRHRLP